jgi:methionyl-tRNA formyltransferase
MSNPPLKVCFIGCVEFSQAALTLLASSPDARIVAVVTRRASRVNSDFVDLAPCAERLGAACIHAEDAAGANVLRDFVRESGADVIYCFGWSSLLPGSVLSSAPLGVIGFHPSPLPRGRGRHPVIWSIVLGLSVTASSFFYMTEGMDDGDLISQRCLPIRPEDDARALYDRITRIALEQIALFTSQLRDGSAPRMPQDHSLATYWRKRTPADGEVDWRMSAEAILNLVRALRPPYPGATLSYGARRAIIVDAELGPMAAPDLEPGRVLAIEGRTVLVKAAGTGSVRLLDHSLQELPAVGTCL